MTVRPWQVVLHHAGKPAQVVRTYSTRDAALQVAADNIAKLRAAGISSASYAVRKRRAHD